LITLPTSPSIDKYCFGTHPAIPVFFEMHHTQFFQFGLLVSSLPTSTISLFDSTISSRFGGRCCLITFFFKNILLLVIPNSRNSCLSIICSCQCGCYMSNCTQNNLLLRISKICTFMYCHKYNIHIYTYQEYFLKTKF